MKKTAKFITILATTFLVIYVAAFTLNSKNTNSQKTSPSTTPTQTPQNYQAKIIVSAPDENFFIEYETHTKRMHQPFSVLQEALEQNNTPLDYETYDFGVFVKSINNLESTDKKAWIYFVNGQSGQVAADKYQLEKGDLVEWKFIKPQ